jgi:uncharacterized protein YceH (UPF0502 family)
VNPLSFQFLIRGTRLAELDGQMEAAAIEQRDRDLEDYIGRLEARVVALETKLASLRVGYGGTPI